MIQRQILSDWAGQKIAPFMAVFMMWQGMSVFVLGDGRLTSASYQGLREGADLLNAPLPVLLLVMFFAPGLLILIHRTRRFGLLISTLTFLLFAIGNVRALVVNNQATIMGVNTYVFLAVLSAWLYTTERYTR